MSMSIPRKEIKRKELPASEVEEPQLAHLKETGANDTTAWEAPGDAKNNRKGRFLGAGAGWALSDRLDRILPPHKRYLGRSRRTLLIAILVAFLCLLALVIGLAVGLSKKAE